MALIQIKTSLANSAPTTLEIGEPAYSYSSNTLFIGTANGDGYIMIGGQAYLDKINSAYAAANASSNLTNIVGGFF
jgi:hypothetical protein